MKIQNQLVKYFNGIFIGSYLFAIDNLLDESEINDIDVAIHSDKLAGAREFMKDNGYVETVPPYSQVGYASREGSLVFHKDGCKSIHLVKYTESKFETFTIAELIKSKVVRGSMSDIDQCISVLNSMKNIKENTKKVKI